MKRIPFHRAPRLVLVLGLALGSALPLAAQQASLPPIWERSDIPVATPAKPADISMVLIGPDTAKGIIYDVYFDQQKNVDAGTPLIVVCPPEQQSAVEDVVARVQSEWVEGE